MFLNSFDMFILKKLKNIILIYLWMKNILRSNYYYNTKH
jgi:hypothetical protein